MEKDNFLNIMAEWNYAIKNYLEELPWQVLVYNCADRQSLTITAIEPIRNGLKIITDTGSLIISPTSRWHIRHGRTAKHRTIFTQNLDQGEQS